MMAAMPDTVSPRVPWRNLGIGWALMILAATVYAAIKHIPLHLALPVAIAFAIELPFYVMAGNPPSWLRRPAILAFSDLLDILAVGEGSPVL